MAERSRVGLAVALAGVVLLLDPGGIATPAAALLWTCLLFWLPGAALWWALRPGACGLAEWLLLPPLLGLLPASALLLALLRLGMPARAACAVVLASSALLLLALRSRRPRLTGGDTRVVVGAVLLALLFVGAPLAANGGRADAWDGPLHAAVAAQILGGPLPPASPLVADEQLHYYWLYHLISAVVAETSGLDLYRVFGQFDVVGFFLFALAGASLTQRVAGSSGRLAGMALLAFGLNGLGWIRFLLRAAGHADAWDGLLVPFETAPGRFAQLGSLLHLFLDGNPFPLAFPFALLFLRGAAEALEAPVDRRTVLTTALALAGALHIHLLLGALLAATVAAAALLAGGRRALPVLGAQALAGLVTLPYAAGILLGRASGPAPVRFSLDALGPGLLEVLACLGPLAVLAAVGLRGLHARATRFLALGALVPLLAYPATEVAGGAQYKLLYLALLALAPLAVAATAGPAGRWLRPAAVLLFLPTSVLTGLAFARHPPREDLSPERATLMVWIRDATPPRSVFVEEPVWEREGRTTAQLVRDDRRYFDIVLHGRRRMFVGYDAVVLAAQWGHADVPRRERLAARLLAGEPLNRAQRRYLGSLSGPLYVIVHHPPAGGAFPAARYRLVHQAHDARVYELLP